MPRLMSLALCVPLALLTPGARSAEPGPPSPLHLAVKDAPAENVKGLTVFDRLVALAATGNADAQYNLGMFYNNGIGTQRDIFSALNYFSKAAQAGHLLVWRIIYQGLGQAIRQEDWPCCSS